MKQILSQYWEKIQGTLFPMLEVELSPLTEKQQQLVTILELVRIEEFLPSYCSGFRGRPPKSRRAIARSFVAKAVYNMPTTTVLIERLHSDISLRRICGWESKYELPDESVFSRAFSEFASTGLPVKVHEALIKKNYDDEIVGHVSVDATAIEAREKPVKKEMTKEEEKHKKLTGRSKRVKKKSNELTRIQKQTMGLMTLEEMLTDLPKQCDRGGKTNSKGHMQWWNGYKLHMSVDDHGVPLAGIISAASLHDSQAAIPLLSVTSQRVKNFYDLMDSGYDAPGIIEFSKAKGHVPIVDHLPRDGREEKFLEKKARKTINLKPAEIVRFEIRTSVERAFSRLKNEFGADFVRVRGAAKVSTHVMFGLLALAADQLIKIIT